MAETAPPGPVDPKDLELFSKLAANPQDIISGQFRGYLEDLIRITVGTQKNFSPYAVGIDLRIIPEDLTAETGAYEYEDALGVFLYGNGAVYDPDVYPELYAVWGANKWGADVGGDPVMPDLRGRTLVLCGTHADVDLGDNDGTTEANRRPKHPHTNGVTFTPGNGSLAVTAGSLAITPDPHKHAAASGSFVVTGGVSGVAAGANLTTAADTATTSLAITGTPALTGTVGGSVGGTVGAAGGTTDSPSYIVIGSAFYRAR